MLFLGAGVTDTVDGAVARLTNSRSELGAVLDPMADKLLLLSSFIVLGFSGAIATWLVVLVVVRDVIVVLGYGAVFVVDHEWMEVAPSRLGKLSTFFQLFTIGFALMHLARPALPLGTINSDHAGGHRRGDRGVGRAVRLPRVVVAPAARLTSRRMSDAARRDAVAALTRRHARRWRSLAAPAAAATTRARCSTRSSSSIRRRASGPIASSAWLTIVDRRGGEAPARAGSDDQALRRRREPLDHVLSRARRRCRASASCSGSRRRSRIGSGCTCRR